jgi:general secretion pathway protein K
VVQGAGEQLVVREAGAHQFRVLLTALDVPGPEAQAVAAALIDWIDSDDIREVGGAEDEAYASLSYRTAGAPLAEASELRAVRGVTPELYARIRPFVCALPTTDLSPINVNTLPPERAVLISMLTDGAVGPEAARRVLARRPPDGWADLHAFWRDQAFADVSPPGEAYQQVQTRTRFFNLETEVAFADAEVVSSALFEQDAAGEVRLAARRWTRDE